MSFRNVARVPVHTGPAGWNSILPPAPSRAALVGEQTCDIAIVSAGFPGLSAARRLMQLDPKLSVIVVDAGRVAESSAGRNSGFMIDLPHGLTSADHAIPDGTFQRSGEINGAASPVGEAANRSYASHLQALGEPHAMLDGKAMRDVTGSAYYSGGLYTPGTAMLQPAAYIRGLAQGHSAQGVRVCESSPVTGFESAGEGWVLTTPQGRLRAAKVILANNGHLESFGFKAGRLMHIMLNACMTGEIGADDLRKLGGQETLGLTPSDPMGCTVRRISQAQGGNRIVIRQGAYYRPNIATSPADLARVTARMRAKFDARFPGLRHAPFDYAWSGHLRLSKNAVSVMGELEPGLFSACVQNGLGTTRVTLTGIGVAELATGKASDITCFFTAEAEPALLPPHPFDTIGANAYLRWKEWQARTE